MLTVPCNLFRCRSYGGFALALFIYSVRIIVIISHDVIIVCILSIHIGLCDFSLCITTKEN